MLDKSMTRIGQENAIRTFKLLMPVTAFGVVAKSLPSIDGMYKSGGLCEKKHYMTGLPPGKGAANPDDKSVERTEEPVDQNTPNESTDEKPLALANQQEEGITGENQLRVNEVTECVSTLKVETSGKNTTFASKASTDEPTRILNSSDSDDSSNTLKRNNEVGNLKDSLAELPKRRRGDNCIVPTVGSGGRCTTPAIDEKTKTFNSVKAEIESMVTAMSATISSHYSQLLKSLKNRQENASLSRIYAKEALHWMKVSKGYLVDDSLKNMLKSDFYEYDADETMLEMMKGCFKKLDKTYNTECPEISKILESTNPKELDDTGFTDIMKTVIEFYGDRMMKCNYLLHQLVTTHRGVIYQRECTEKCETDFLRWVLAEVQGLKEINDSQSTDEGAVQDDFNKHIEIVRKLDDQYELNIVSQYTSPLLWDREYDPFDMNATFIQERKRHWSALLGGMQLTSLHGHSPQIDKSNQQNFCKDVRMRADEFLNDHQEWSILDPEDAPFYLNNSIKNFFGRISEDYNNSFNRVESPCDTETYSKCSGDAKEHSATNSTRRENIESLYFNKFY